MATAQEIADKHTEFQAAVADMDTAFTAYEAAKTPYLAAKQTYTDALARVDVLDNELEALTDEYEPQSPPESV